MSDYDAIVIGAGHAGIEASLALSREGYETILITQSLDAVGRLSCNPAIGGLSKGNIVREIDALGGEMAHLIDSTMIQFRILNRRRGPAVQAPRAQADKFSYSRLAKETLEKDFPDGLIWDCCFVRETGNEVARIYVAKEGLDLHRREHWGDFFSFMARQMYLLERNFMSIAEYLRE